MFAILKLINRLDFPLFRSKSTHPTQDKNSETLPSSVVITPVVSLETTAPQDPPRSPEPPVTADQPVESPTITPIKNTETNKGISGMFLHIMLKVSDLPRSTQFYTKALGLNLLREDHKPDAGYALAFVSFGKGNSDKHFEIQLTQLFNNAFVPQGNAFGNLTIAVNNVELICTAIADHGGQVLREPGLRGNRMSAKVQDPDGYQIELIQYE
jgi:lactoylglutathione lyase